MARGKIFKSFVVTVGLIAMAFPAWGLGQVLHSLSEDSQASIVTVAEAKSKTKKVKKQKQKAVVAPIPVEENKTIQAATSASPASSNTSTYFVSPSGSDATDGHSEKTPWKSIQKAFNAAQPGNIIHLADGTYSQDILSRRNGTSDKPITLTGSSKAIVNGGGNGRIIEINHDYLTLDGFTVDGLTGSGKKESHYRDKLIYVLGKDKKAGVTGLKIQRMTIRNAGGECIRLRYFTQKNEVSQNTIQNCGVHDFAFKAGGKNGEGVYIGTAPEQLKDGKNPTKDTDQSNENWIHHNVFDTQGNECVDIKEGASGNIIEHNRCTGQRDPESGGMDSRGNGNIFRHNEIYGNWGAGVRLGGDNKTYGIQNLVYANNIHDNRAGAIKLMQMPQSKVCGNTLVNNKSGDFVGKYASKSGGNGQCL